MKITAIEPFVCDGGIRQFGFLKVTTDEGIVGWSEIYDFTAVASLATAIRIIGREFIGLDPFRIEWFNERMWYLARPGITERIKVLAALDMALWDIKGKALDVPVYELLGGLIHDHLECYGTGPLPRAGAAANAPAEGAQTARGGGSIGDRAKGTIESGFRAFRFTPG